MNNEIKKTCHFDALSEAAVADAQKVFHSKAPFIKQFSNKQLELLYTQESLSRNKFYLLFGMKCIASIIVAFCVLYGFYSPSVYTETDIVTSAIIQFSLVFSCLLFALHFIKTEYSNNVQETLTLIYIVLVNSVFAYAPFFYCQESMIFMLSTMSTSVSIVYTAYLVRLRFYYAIVFHGFIFLFTLVFLFIYKNNIEASLQQAYLFGLIIPNLLLILMSLYQQTVHRRNFLSKVLLQYQNEQLLSIANEDSLTSIANRRKFDECLNNEWQRLKRKGEPLSLLLLDIDCFKNYNDSYGHQMGDECIRNVAVVLSSLIQRELDLVARYGGEEFVAILPDTDETSAMAIANKIRKVIEKLAIEHDKTDVVNVEVLTVSVGVATAYTDGGYDEPLQFLKQADDALYRAKETGRNKVVHINEI